MNTNIPEILNPLKHSGTNKFERLGKELDVDYVKIEERHEADFIAQAEKLAGAIQFYDQNDYPSGDWALFFDQQSPTNQPHRALFIAFLRLLEALNEHANGLTKRHLDFYYQEVLQFGTRAVKPAQAHLFFNCAQTLKERFLEKGTLLQAGKNEAGKEILFELVNELVVNKATISNYFVLHQHSDEFENRLFSKNYSNFLTAGATENQEGFPTFGEQQLVYNKVDGDFIPELMDTANQTMDQASIGFAISSPLLRLDEGERTIRLRLSLAGTYPNDFVAVKELFQFEITTEEGWFKLLNEEDELPNISTLRDDDNHNDLMITLTLRSTDPAFVNYDKNIHEAAYNSHSPVIRMMLKHDATSYGYPAWKNATIEHIGLQVKFVLY